MGNQMQNNSLVQAWNMVKTAQNPQQALINALSQGNDGQQILDILKRCNGDSQKAFFEYARVTGKDGSQLIQQLQSMGLK
jgi:hypothetical protein